METVKVIIAGSRSFNDYKLLIEEVQSILVNPDTFWEIVSGTSKGADKLGERFAKDFNFKLSKFPAKWNIYGKAAGPVRNEKMAKYADILIAFWDGDSSGTKNMIELANKYNLEVHIIYYNENL